MYTLPETNNIAPARKRGPQKETIIFQPSIFRRELLVSGRVYMYIHTRRLKMKAAKTAIDSIPIQCSPSGRAGPAPMAKLCLCKHKAAPQRKKLLGMSPDVATGKKSKHHSEYHGRSNAPFRV